MKKTKEVHIQGKLIICLFFYLVIQSIVLFIAVTHSEAIGESIAGRDRIETAIKISQKRNSKTVIIVNNTSFADAISAVNLAKTKNASILLNSKGRLDQRNIDEINRIKPKEIFIIGGVEVINSSIERNLKKQCKVTRISGKNRYDTNQKVNEYVFKGKYEYAIVTNGTAFADLLSIGAFAYQNQIPIFFTDKEGKQLKKLNIQDKNIRITYLIGGERVISPSIEKIVKNPERIFGQNRYETSLKVHNRFYQGQKEVFATTGEEFADALAGVTLCTKGQNILLVKQSVKEIPENSKYNFTTLGGRIQNGKGVAIYVNPHQDDETLSMGLQLIRDRNNGKEIFLLQMTNGDRSGAIHSINRALEEEGFPQIDQEELHLARDRELLDVLDRLGLPKESMIDHGHPNEN